MALNSNLRCLAGIETLWQEKMKNFALFQVVERGSFEDLKITGNSLRLKDTESGCYMFTIDAENDIPLLVEDIRPKLDVFFINSDLYLSQLEEIFPEARFDTYLAYVMLDSDINEAAPPIDTLPGLYTFAVPDTGWADYITSVYKNDEFNSIEYIRDRLLRGSSLGIKYKNEKAAFVLQHKNGEIGPIIVDEKHRRKGLGSVMMKTFCHRLLKYNGVAFALVHPDNLASARMMEACGLKRAPRPVVWGYRQNQH